MPGSQPSLSAYVHHDIGPCGTCTCPSGACQSGDVVVRDALGAYAGDLTCPVCSGHGTVSAALYRAYWKRILFAELATDFESGGRNGQDGGRYLAERLDRAVRSLGQGLPDDRDVLTVRMAILFGTPWMVDGYGFLETDEERDQRQAGRI